ncbi:acetyl-CoA carboxylase biotin carboxyl carrier protein [Eilatimonas milleporae]|uniref:Biotin carboxyl carrier protein of acetyl-CoA carboxylase n=1 Tax=Eilatimonas milleporae TaxID=911205 RepID=A0A3M0CGQ7_9PROT|nr:acetyl-CoA carboxylase biotin carboxyl carrier protein [Eilatimonas milleporae]RMB08552.1 biotin carboxyl carrier protein [Eilatimonas milleporae]
MSKLHDYKDLIREMADLLDQSSLSEIEVEEDDFRIRVAREITAPTITQVAVPGQGPAAQTVPVAPAPGPAASETAPAATDPAQHPGVITAPMVGTAYAAPSPDAEPFIKVGDSVKEGDTILIIEAMKVMNQIAATKSGTVKEIHFQDGQPVEYGEPLCIVE